MENNSENDNHFEKNQCDNSLQENKKNIFIKIIKWCKRHPTTTVLITNRKIILSIILGFTIIICSLICYKHKSKYRFYTYGSKLSYNHNKEVFKLDSGNILFLGSNSYIGNDNIPTEIYNPHTKEVKVIYFPFDTELYYLKRGLLLKNNKLLLTHAYYPNKKEYIENKSFPYDSMAIIDLENMQIVKTIKKQINTKYKPFPNSTVKLIGDNIVYLYQDNKIEIINLDTNSSKILDGNFLKGDLIPTKNNKCLLFTRNTSKNNQSYDVYEYDILTNTLKKISKVIKRDYALIEKISEDKIIIIGGGNPNKRLEPQNREIEIYDINTNISKVVAKLLVNRCSFGEGALNFAKISDNKLLIINGTCNMPSIMYGGQKQNPDPGQMSEILDLNTYEIVFGPEQKPPYRNRVNIIRLNDNSILINHLQLLQILNKEGKW